MPSFKVPLCFWAFGVPGFFHMNLIIGYLLGILTARKPKENHRNGTDYPANSSGTQSAPQQPLSVICIPPPTSDEQRAQKKKRERRNSALFYVQVGSLIVLTLYAGVTVLIYCATNKSANAARDTIKEMQEARRPWVGLENGVVGVSQPSFFFGIPPRVVQHPSITIPVTYVLKNFGNSPALHESDIPGIIAVDPVNTTPPTDQIEFQCGYAETLSTNKGAANPGAGNIILPGASKHVEWNVTPIVPPTQQHLERLWVFVCVTYQDGWTKNIHHSKYWYMTTHQNLGTRPTVPVAAHPEWTFISITGVTAWGAEAD